MMNGIRVAVAAFGLAMTMSGAAAESELVWLEKADLPLEGQAFADAKPIYGRLCERHEGKVPEKVWRLSQSSTGLLLRFETDARTFEVRWRMANEHPQDPLIPEAGLSGIDVYRLEGREGWKFQGTKRYWSNRYGAKRGDAPVPGEARIDWRPGAAGLIYLPTRGVVLDFKIGVPKGCSFKAYAHENGRERPVVHYGTSIVHGGCASRPGLTFTAQVGRSLDIPYVNLGFSGAGQMEPEMADVMAEVKASLYVVDCVWNMNPKLVEERAEVFLRRLRAKRPETPILLAEGANSRESRLPTNDALYAVYAKLKNENPKMWERLHYLAEEDILLRGDLEQTHDFCHPNDHGMMRMAQSFEKAIGGILKLEPRVLRGSRFVPTLRHTHYGPHPKQILNFYRAPGEGRKPVYVYIHGGGWLGGDGVADAEIGRTDNNIAQCFRMGISYAVINYRLGEKLPAPVYDAAHGIQYLRAHADELGIDKNRLVAVGFSAGATTSLWLACHPDLAEPQSSDPVRRESTRVNAAIVSGVQATIDPEEMRRWGVEDALKAHDMIRRAGGFRTFEELKAGLSSVRGLYRQFSSSNFVGPDTPPIRLYGSDLNSKDWIHHGLFAVNFKRVADAKGAPNVELVMPNAPGRYRNDWAFIADLFGL